MIGEARDFLAELLAPLGIPVNPYPPNTLAPPAAVIIPGNPYYERLTIGSREARIGLTVQLAVTAAPGTLGLRALDDLIHRAVTLLADSSVNVEPVAGITNDENGLLTARIHVTIHWVE